MPTSKLFLLPRLFFLMLGAAGGCSSAVAPVLQVDLVAGVPMDTGKIDVIVTRADGKSGTTYFLKDGINRFTLTPPGPTSSMLTTSVAVELPLGTSGVVQVRIETRAAVPPGDMGAASMPKEPAAEAAGCVMTTLVPGALTTLAMTLMMPAQPCPS